MSKKKAIAKPEPIYERIREILESARSHVARTVNTTQVVANWLIGREIVEEEQRGQKRARYGEELLKDLSRQLARDFGSGYSVSALQYMRAFFLTYPELLKKQHAARVELPSVDSAPKQHAASGRYEIGFTATRESWEPGGLHPNLSWTHYRTLLKVENPEARAFYEIEATENHWSARELERQINSLLYERLALSRDKKGLKRLAKKGQEIQTPADVFKDPMVIEFLGLPESPRVRLQVWETLLEQVLLLEPLSLLIEHRRPQSHWSLVWPLLPHGHDRPLAAHRRRDHGIPGSLGQGRRFGHPWPLDTEHSWSSLDPQSIKTLRGSGNPALFSPAQRDLPFTGPRAEDLVFSHPNCLNLASGVDRQGSAIHRTAIQEPGSLAELDRRAEGFPSVAGTHQVHVARLGEVVAPHDMDPAARIARDLRLTAGTDLAASRGVELAFVLPGRSAIGRTGGPEFHLLVAQV